MSAPQTDPEKQARRHKPSLLGIAIAVIFGVALITFLTVKVADRGETPDGAEVQIDGATGDPVPQD